MEKFFLIFFRVGEFSKKQIFFSKKSRKRGEFLLFFNLGTTLAVSKLTNIEEVN